MSTIEPERPYLAYPILLSTRIHVCTPRLPHCDLGMWNSLRLSHVQATNNQVTCATAAATTAQLQQQQQYHHYSRMSKRSCPPNMTMISI